MARFADYLTDVADIITSTTTDGDVRVNLGNAATNDGIASSVAVFGIDGFVSRPNDADPSEGAATALYIHSGNQLLVLGTRDRRYASKVGDLQPGDRAIVSSGNARFLLKNEQERVVLYTEKQSGDHSSMMVSLSGASEKITMSVGLDKVELGGDKIELSLNGGPALVLDRTTNSITLRANTINIDGGLVTVGLLPGGVRPVAPGVNSALYGPAGQVGLPSSTVLVAI